MHIDDKVLYQAFVSVFNAIVENREHFIEKWRTGMKSENVLVRYKAGEFIKLFEEAEVIQDFDIDLYYKVIEKITVYLGNRIIVRLLDGTEVECEIE